MQGIIPNVEVIKHGDNLLASTNKELVNIENYYKAVPKALYYLSS